MDKGNNNMGKQHDDEVFGDEEEEEEEGTSLVTFCDLLGNRQFLMYFCSFLVSYGSSFFSQTANVVLIIRFGGSAFDVSLLFVVKYLANILFSSFLGSFIADAFDRRACMMILDVVGALVPLSYFIALHYESIDLIFFFFFIQQGIFGMFDPCRSAVLPQIVNHDTEKIAKGNQLGNIFSWGFMGALGASLGGTVADVYGVKAVYVLDSLAYLMSAVFMFLAEELKYPKQAQTSSNSTSSETSPQNTKTSNPQGQSHNEEGDSGLAEGRQSTVINSLFEGIRYLRSQFWGRLVFMRMACGLTAGAGDVFRTAFAAEGEGSVALKISYLYAGASIGAALGPFISMQFSTTTSMRSFQLNGLSCILFSVFGLTGLTLSNNFDGTLLFCMIEVCGACAISLNTAVMLQTFSDGLMLGRVMAFELALQLCAALFGALVTGAVETYLSMSASQSTAVIAVFQAVIFLHWLIYHLLGRGAASSAAVAYNLVPTEAEAVVIQRKLRRSRALGTTMILVLMGTSIWVNFGPLADGSNPISSAVFGYDAFGDTFSNNAFAAGVVDDDQEELPSNVTASQLVLHQNEENGPTMADSLLESEIKETREILNEQEEEAAALERGG